MGRRQDKRMNEKKIYNGIVTDDQGRIVGRYEMRNRDLVAGEIRKVREFLLNVTKQAKGENPMSENEKVNMCFIAGEIKNLKMREDEGFMLVDVGPKSKFLACTIYQSKQLAEIAAQFSEGDFIKLVGFVRGWSQKKNDEWQNHVDVRITEIRTTPPERKKQTAKAERKSDYPF